MPYTKAEQALEDLYAEIPQIPCTGRCVEACGPIAMFAGEWKRVTRSAGRTPRVPRGSLTCPLLSPTGKCTVYTVRPYICRLWGTVPDMRCPFGCEPERWLTTEEARSIFERIAAIAGPEIAGPLGSVEDLWETIGLARRAQRALAVEQARDHLALKAAIDEARALIEGRE